MFWHTFRIYSSTNIASVSFSWRRAILFVYICIPDGCYVRFVSEAMHFELIRFSHVGIEKQILFSTFLLTNIPFPFLNAFSYCWYGWGCCNRSVLHCLHRSVFVWKGYLFIIVLEPTLTFICFQLHFQEIGDDDWLYMVERQICCGKLQKIWFSWTITFKIELSSRFSYIWNSSISPGCCGCLTAFHVLICVATMVLLRIGEVCLTVAVLRKWAAWTVIRNGTPIQIPCVAFTFTFLSPFNYSYKNVFMLSLWNILSCKEFLSVDSNGKG